MIQIWPKTGSTGTITGNINLAKIGSGEKNRKGKRELKRNNGKLYTETKMRVKRAKSNVQRAKGELFLEYICTCTVYNSEAYSTILQFIGVHIAPHWCTAMRYGLPETFATLMTGLMR